MRGGTSWPFWIGVLGIIFIITLRSSLADLIHRITEIGRKGIRAAPHEQRTGKDPRTAADELLGYLDNQYVRAQEDVIKKELEQRGVTDDPAEAMRVLTRYTAAALITADFERVDNTLWGSQIEVLEYLNSVEKASRDHLQPYYDLAAVTYPDTFERYPFDRYMEFLVTQGLVLQQDDTFAITLKGRSFLLYIVQTGKPLRRIL